VRFLPALTIEDATLDEGLKIPEVSVEAAITAHNTTTN